MQQNVTQKRSNFISIVFHTFSIFDCHLFFAKLIEKKKDEGKLATISETHEEYKSAI